MKEYEDINSTEMTLFTLGVVDAMETIIQGEVVLDRPAGRLEVRNLAQGHLGGALEASPDPFLLPAH